MKNPFKYAEGKKVEIMNKQSKQLKRLYREVLKDTKQSLKRLENKDSRYAINKKMYLEGFKNDLLDRINMLDARTEQIVNVNMNDMVQVVLQNNETFLKGVGFKGYINTQPMKMEVVNRIATGQIYGGKWNLSSAIWGDNAKKADEINKIIAKGVAEGKSLYSISKQLEKYVNPNARTPSNIPGVRSKVDYNAQRLARTAVQHAYQEAFVAATINNPFIDGYRWVTSGSHNVCPLCIERATTDKYGLGEGVFPKSSLPLDHPNGQCTFECVSSMSDAEIGEAIADWYLGEGDPYMNEQLDEFAKYLMNY